MALPRKGHIVSKKNRKRSLLGKWGGGGKRRRIELIDQKRKVGLRNSGEE